jgi:hypothetical protein
LLSPSSTGAIKRERALDNTDHCQHTNRQNILAGPILETGIRQSLSGDDKHINSIVKLKIHPQMRTNALTITLAYVTCLTPRFARYFKRPQLGILLRDRTFKDKKIATYKSLLGDYPLDQAARMVPMPEEGGGGTSQLFAQHLYYWLRNGNLRPSMASVIAMLDEQFNTKPGEIYTYEFAKEGRISRRIMPKDPFPEGVLSDNQISDVADTSLLNDLVNPIIVFKDNVSCLGTTYGGKHAGQPIPGKSLSWCEMSDWGSDSKELGR